MIPSNPTHTAHRYPIPDEVLAAFPSEDTPSLEELWDWAGGYHGPEPDARWYRQAGIRIWQNLQPAIEVRRRNPVLRLVSPLRIARPMRYYAMAACIAVLLAVGIVVTDRGAMVEAPYGEQLVHELPDGSTMHLNSGTKLTYAKAYGDEGRDIRLTHGEVFFDVTTSDVPFRVHTFNGTVSVLGTSFNVRAWPSGHTAATDVTVREGSVQLAARTNPEGGVVLEAGDAARLAVDSDMPIALGRPGVDNAVSWASGSFKFADHTIGTIFDELERRYDVRIDVASEDFLDKRIGVLIESPANEEEIIRAICELNCEYRSVPGGYVVDERETE